MVPPSAARRSRGCSVRTDNNAGTRKGGNDDSPGIEMPLGDDGGPLELEQDVVPCLLE
jgi:hypothetical protein